MADLFNDKKRLNNITIRFWKYTNKLSNHDCWEWNSKQHNEHGYGHLFSGRGVIIKAHRLSYSLHIGCAMNDQDNLLHSCDNPKCVNPYHLSTGTQLENIQDCISKNRNSKPPISYGEQHHNTKFKESDIINILADKRSYMLIANDYGVCAETIGRVKRKQTWKLQA